MPSQISFMIQYFTQTGTNKATLQSNEIDNRQTRLCVRVWNERWTRRGDSSFSLCLVLFVLMSLFSPIGPGIWSDPCRIMATTQNLDTAYTCAPSQKSCLYRFWHQESQKHKHWIRISQKFMMPGPFNPQSGAFSMQAGHQSSCRPVVDRMRMLLRSKSASGFTLPQAAVPVLRSAHLYQCKC